MNKPKTIIFLILLVLFFSLGAFSFSFAADTEFANPLKYNTVEEVATNLLTSLKNIVAVLAVLFIVIGGMMYIFSSGDEKRIETAKKIITGAAIGFAIVLIAPSLLREIGDVLGWSGTSTATKLDTIAARVLTFLLSIAGIIAIIFLVIGGMTYMGGFSNVIGSGDSKKSVETGKKIITNAIIGIIVIMAALVIVNQIDTLLK